jgi:CHAT domain-containing protein/tetratricopeptide (TPR) repeat protein
MPQKEMPNADELLALPLKEAAGLLRAIEDPADPVNDLLSQLPQLGPRTLRGALLIAAVFRARQPPDELARVLKHLLRWLHAPADDLVQRGELDDARALLSEIHSALRDAAGADAAYVPTFAELDHVAARLALAADELADVEHLLRQALRAFEQLGDAAHAVQVRTELGMLLWHAGDAAGATDHLAHAAERLEASAAVRAEPGLAQSVFERLAVTAEALYYEKQQPELAARLAQHLTVLKPDDAAGWQLLANALARLERFEGAARAYARVAQLLPGDARSRGNLAMALVKLGHCDEALRALDESLNLAPREVRPLVLRGQLRAQSGDANGAVVDLQAVLDLLEADRPVDNDTPDGTRRYLEHWQMWLAAYHNLIQIQRKQGDRGALESTARRLIDTSDNALSAMGHRLVGDLAREDGRLADALSAYQAALQVFPADGQARKLRAAVAAEMGDLDSAIGDLAALAPRDRAPREAIEGLEGLRARSQRPEILRWLGFAQFEIADFVGSDANLDAYLQQVPGDVEARRWLGLSLISITGAEDSRQNDMQRLFRGLEELARAAADGDTEGREAMLWLLDRLMVGDDLFLLPIGGSKPIAKALPEVLRVLDMLAQARDRVILGRDWSGGIEVLSDCIFAANALGLKCFATYGHVLLSEFELQRGNVDAAARHAREAMQLRSLALTARTAHLRASIEKKPGFEAEAGDMGLEIEHLHVYNWVILGLHDAEMATARARSSAGDRAGALEALGNIAEFVARAKQGSARKAEAAARILRDVELTEDALAVLERAEARAESNEVRASILVGRANILGKLGRLLEALKLLREAEPLIDESRRWVVWLNAASGAQAYGLNAETLKLLDQIDIDRVARSDEDRFNFHYLRAAALDGLGRGAEAQDTALKAMGMLETLRGSLRDLALRAAWTGKKEAAYALAVRITARNGDAGLAFDLCERARSRQLADEIAIGHSALDDEGRALERRLRNAEEGRDLLAAIAGQGEGQRPPPELILRLRELNPEVNLMELGDDGINRVSAQELTRARSRLQGAIERLRRDIGENRLASAERLFGTVAGRRQIADLLKDHVSRVVLVELFVQEGNTLGFVLRADRESPQLEHIAIGREPLLEWTKALLASVTQADGYGGLKEIQAPLQPLLAAVEQNTDQDDVVCIVPHGPLHLIPFHALELSGGPLIRRNPVVYAPSASVLASIAQRDPGCDRRAAIVVGDTRGDLPYAGHEAEVVADILAVKAIPGALATRRRLIEAIAAARNLRILHLACHGTFNVDDALASGVLTAVGEDASEDAAVLSAQDILDVQMAADLVALSACESGISERRPGDELVGLTRALLVAGARTVLASLWKVNDLSTSILMRAFYEGWVRDGLPKAQALRRAQCRVMDLTAAELRASKEARPRTSANRDFKSAAKADAIPVPSDGDARIFAAPRHWAAFTLVGDWR